MLQVKRALVAALFVLVAVPSFGKEVVKQARANDLALSEKDVEDEIKRRAEAEGVKLSQMRRFLNDNDEMQPLRDRLFYRKVTDFLESKAEITDVAA